MVIEKKLQFFRKLLFYIDGALSFKEVIKIGVESIL